MRIKILTIIVSFLVIFSGCAKNSSVTLNNNQEDLAESKTLAEIAANAKASIIFTSNDKNEENKKQYENKDYRFYLNYPQNFTFAELKSEQEEVKAWILFQGNKLKNEEIDLKIIAVNSAILEKTIENTEEIQVKKEIKLQQQKGLKLIGVEPGRQIFILPLDDKITLKIEINNLNLEEIFDGLIASIKK